MAVELVCDQGDRLRLVLESVHDFAGEARITFRQQGIEIVGQDTAHVVGVRYVLTSKKIREIGGSYEFSNPESPGTPIDVGIRTKVVAGCLKCSPPGDTVSIRIDPAIRGKLILVSRNATKITRWEIVTPTISDDDIDSGSLESLHYSGSITMSSGFFHDMLRDLSTANSSTVKLYCDGTRLVLTSDGLMAKVSFEVANTGDTKSSSEEMTKTTTMSPSDADDDEKTVNTDRHDIDDEEEETEHSDRQRRRGQPAVTSLPPKNGNVASSSSSSSATTAVFTKNADGTWPVSESYAYKFLSLIAKAKNLSSRITICIRPNFPAAFFYDSPVGTLTFIVAPREDEDDEGFVPAPSLPPPPPPLPTSIHLPNHAPPLPPSLSSSPQIPETTTNESSALLQQQSSDGVAFTMKSGGEDEKTEGGTVVAISTLSNKAKRKRKREEEEEEVKETTAARSPEQQQCDEEIQPRGVVRQFTSSSLHKKRASSHIKRQQHKHKK